MSKIKSINFAKVQAFGLPKLFASQNGSMAGGNGDLVDDSGLPAITGTGPIARRLVGWDCLQLPIGFALEPTFIIGFSADAYNADIANAIKVRAKGLVGLPGLNGGFAELQNPRIFDYEAKGAIVRPGDFIYLDFTRCAKGLWAAYDIASLYEATSPSTGTRANSAGSIEDARQLVDILLTYQGEIRQCAFFYEDEAWLAKEHKTIRPESKRYNNMGRTYHMSAEVGRTYKVYTTLLKSEQPSFIGYKPELIAFYDSPSLTDVPYQGSTGVCWTDSATGSTALGQKNASLLGLTVQVPGQIAGSLGYSVFAPKNWLENDFFYMQLPATAQTVNGLRFFVQKHKGEYAEAIYNLQISQNNKGELYLHADDGLWSVDTDTELQPLFYSTIAETDFSQITGQGIDTDPYLLSLNRQTILRTTSTQQTVFYLYSGLSAGQRLSFAIEVFAGLAELVGIDVQNSSSAFSDSSLPDLKLYWTINGAQSGGYLSLQSLYGKLTVPAGVNGLMALLGAPNVTTEKKMLEVSASAGLTYSLRLKLLELQ